MGINIEVMNMEIHIPTAILVVLAALSLVAWLIKENLRDEEEFEKDLNQSEFKPDLHKEESM
jgi:anaerobic C4-dicarboxylate transporter